MRKLLILLFLFTPFSISAENCEVTLRKFCPTGEKKCVDKNIKGIGNKCYAEFYKILLEKRNSEFSGCMEQMKKLCSSQNSRECYEKNKNQFASNCRDHLEMMFSTDVTKVELPKNSKGCMNSLVSACKLDMKLFSKDPKKATDKLKSCFAKAREKKISRM